MDEGQIIMVRDNGATLTLGPDSDYRIVAFDPDAMPTQRPSDSDGLSGDLVGVDREGGRDMTATILLEPHVGGAGTIAEANTALEILRAFMQPTNEDVLLRWMIGGVERMRWVRCRGVGRQYGKRKLGVVTTNWRAATGHTYGPPVTEDIGTSDTVVAIDGLSRTNAYLFECESDGTLANPVLELTLNGADVFQLRSSGGVANGAQWEVDGRLKEVRVRSASGTAFTFPPSFGAGASGAVLHTLPPDEVTAKFTHGGVAATGLLTVWPAF